MFLLGPEDTLKSCRKISKLSIMMVIISIMPSGTIVSIVVIIAVILNHIYIYVGLPNIALPMPQFTGPKEAFEMAPLHWGLFGHELKTHTPFFGFSREQGNTFYRGVCGLI